MSRNVIFEKQKHNFALNATANEFQHEKYLYRNSVSLEGENRSAMEMEILNTF